MSTAPLPCFETEGSSVQFLKVECETKDVYGFPYGHLIYFHHEEATASVDSDVLHIRFSVKAVRIMGTNLRELLAPLSENTLKVIRKSFKSQEGLGKPFITSIQIVEAQASKRNPSHV